MGASAQVTFTYTGAAVPIPDGTGTATCGAAATAVITVPGSATGNITDANVQVAATHSWVGDLIISVARTSPANTVILMDRPGVPATTFGCSGDNVAATFDQTGASGPVETMCGASPPGIFGTPVPEQSLAAFNGGGAIGTWTLSVQDCGGGDTGTLTGWSLILSGVVPVELTRFDATTSGRAVNLVWETASETNNAGFEVQLQQGETWTTLGFVEGHGTTTEANTYAYTAENLLPGSHSFRLRQVDFDGQSEIHGPVEAEVETPGTHLLTSAYPNPFNPQSQFALSVAQAQHV
jgi:subtilisin-like proprotein convertase family protein